MLPSDSRDLLALRSIFYLILSVQSFDQWFVLLSIKLENYLKDRVMTGSIVFYDEKLANLRAFLEFYYSSVIDEWMNIFLL